MTLKLKRTPGLYLVGFMATGKSTVGAAVADELGWAFADIDTAVERRAGKTIADVFREQGEEHFRKLESQELSGIVSRVQAGHPYVVATGGGAFAQPRNWDIVENNGVTVWLDCELSTIETRLGTIDATRPLSIDRERMQMLFNMRRPLYAKADFRIDANCGDPAEVTRQILALPIF